MINGRVSHWWESRGRPEARPALDGSAEVDVVVVGAGYTGLWTALHLADLDPGLRILVLEQRHVGYGASGRNGGWLTNSITGGRGVWEHSHGRAATQRFQDAMNATVAEVVSVTEAEGIDADVVVGGELNVARNAAQLERLEQNHADDASWQRTGAVRLDAAATAQRVRVAGALGGVWHPHCARVHPAKLVAGLAAAVERRGVTIAEDTRVAAIDPGVVTTASGARVRAAYVVRATEGFTSELAGQRRTWLPMNSSMVVTEPLPDAAWDEIGWEGCATLGDFAHAYMYAQRTADGRIALGGRGDPYRYGSRTDLDGQTPASTVAALDAILRDFFPVTRGVPLAHAWSGVLAVPRDWRATVGLDRSTGLAWAGGYVGTGVATAHLAGRTLADLVTGRETDLTSLPWVGHRVRRWEPEPLRWLGVQAMYGAYRHADRAEARGLGRTSRVARLADRVSGRH
ncbi:FAD-dependent oxidoreductase [Aeromicrobium flavum]|uniref:FAD-dependent oxidoreductase n=1 Tax=Aeromicrobium flavum TaxID=416568 RepID=A0A512HXK6_9ACTN|nr:FAD-binding oxidoreductase [Aeromicrobium flavum]GEO90185.1 FAD-dependent oxidoreductase [Aeromicrobium flavum]